LTDAGLTGTITGTPTAAGTFNFTVTTANAAGDDNRDFSIVISAAAVSGGGGDDGSGTSRERDDDRPRTQAVTSLPQSTPPPGSLTDTDDDAAQEYVAMPFDDVLASDWVYPYVRSAWQHQLFQGVAPRTFAPQGDMTRAMFVQVLANHYGVDLAAYAGQNGTFADVSANAWYFAAVQWAASQGIASGTGNGHFDPNRAITREEMAVLLHKLYNYPRDGFAVCCDGHAGRP